MFKKFLLTILVMGLLPVFGASVDNLIKSDSNVFVYLYTNECSFCTKFNSRFNKLSKMYDKKFNFMKINANSKDGMQLMYEFRAPYVPFVVLMNAKKTKIVSPNCLMDIVCLEREITKF